MASYAQNFPALKTDTKVCCNYFCGDIAVSETPMASPIFGTVKVCCCLQGIDCGVDKGFFKTGNEAGKGLVSVFQKSFCCVSTVSLGHLSFVLCDKTHYGPGPIGENAPVMDADLAFMSDVYWWLYLGIFGCGVTKQMDPFCQGETTVLCCEALTETEELMHKDFGVVSKKIKTCCLVTDCKVMPDHSTGCMIFGKELKPASAREADQYAPFHLIVDDAPAQCVM